MPKGGCNEELEYITGHVTKGCPVMYVSDYGVVFQSYIWAKRGFLPHDGGWADQPARLMQGVDIVWDVVAEEELRRARAASDT